MMDIETQRAFYEDTLTDEYDAWLDSLDRVEQAKAWLDSLNVTGCYETALTQHTENEWSEVPY